MHLLLLKSQENCGPKNISREICFDHTKLQTRVIQDRSGLRENSSLGSWENGLAEVTAHVPARVGRAPLSHDNKMTFQWTLQCLNIQSCLLLKSYHLQVRLCQLTALQVSAD